MLVASLLTVNPVRDFFFSFSLQVIRKDSQDFRIGRGSWCGEEGNRTPDLLLAKQALYQLSYSPDRFTNLGARAWI